MARTVTDIIPPSRRRQMEPMAMREEPLPPQRPVAPKRVRRGFPYGTAIVALLIVAGSVTALFVFSGAKVEVTPKTFTASISSDFTATQGGGDLPFEIVTVEKTGTKSVKAESTVTANDSAQGTITIYNTQSAPQTLITNTRFESPEGLIFRIHAPVTVPAGSAEVPGTITATVYADQGGDKYNIPAASFTLPGLKGGKSFTQVYGKSTSAMTGGFSGSRPSVGEATRQEQKGPLESALKEELQKSLSAQMKSGYILIPSSVTTTFTPIPDTAGENGQVVIAEKGVMTAVIFPNEALAKAIAFKVVPMYAGEPVTLGNPDGLTFAPSASSTPASGKPYSFNLSGSTTLVWTIDTAKIGGAVAGKRRESAEAILMGFPEIDKAILILRPFFATTFPADPAKITIEVMTPAKEEKK